MKKLNKLFLAAGSVAAIAAPVAAVVSCGTGGSYDWSKVKAGAFNDQKSQEAPIAGVVGDAVAYVTDGGLTTDHSFNEESFNGVKKFSEDQAARTAGLGWKLVQPTDITSNGFNAAYNSIGNVKDVVLSGFLHDNKGENGDSKTWHSTHSTVNVVAIDIADTNADTYYGITFKTEQSGFLAAVDAGYMLNEQFKDEVAKDDIKVATFGGIKIPPVVSYMNGFIAGVKWFNANKGNLRGLEVIHAGSSDFTGNFNAGGGRALADALLNKGARAILPVAGVQSADVDQAIRAKRLNGKAYLIGVDVDQSATFGGTVLVSAIKGIRAAAIDMLERIHGFNGKTQPSDKNYDLSDGEQFVGAIPNKNYTNPITTEQQTAAINAAKDANAFATKTY